MPVFKFYKEDGRLHMLKHNVTPDEVKEVFKNKNYKSKRKDKSFMALGKTNNDRYLQIVYRKLKDDTIFVITAYELENKNVIDFLERTLYEDENRK